MKTIPSPSFPAVLYVLGAAFLFSSDLASADPRPRFQLQDLGALPSAFSGGSAIAINDRGDVVGRAVNSNHLVRPFLFRDGKMTDPGSAPGWGEAVAINNAGQILTHENVEPELHSFLIDEHNVLDLSAQAGQPVNASSLNAAGVVVGGDLIWNHGSFSRLIPPAGALTAVAIDINESGTIAGLVTIPTPSLSLESFRAAVFNNGSILGLPAGAVGSDGRAINDFGDVAGNAYFTSGGDGQVRAFILVQGKARSLGVLRGDLISYATDINNARQVVGVSLDFVHEPRAFLYSDGVLHDLNDLVKKAAGWHLRTANAINNRGQIAGEALFQGESRPYLLTPIRPFTKRPGGKR